MVELRAAGTTVVEVTGGYGEVYSPSRTWRCGRFAARVQQPAELHQPGVLLHVGRAALGAATSLTPATKYEYRVKDDPDGRTSGHVAAGGGLKTITRRRRRPRPDDERERDGRRAARRPRQRDDRRRPLAGDLSYADGDHYRWDSYALFEPLWSSVPTAHAGGNHEVSNGNENWLYSRRYRTPTSTRAARPSVVLVRGGPAHVVVLCSCAARISRRILGAQFSARNSPTPSPRQVRGHRPARRNSSG